MNNLNKAILSLIFILSFQLGHTQDTLYIKKKPKPILKSWYPEFKESPNLIEGESKILFLIIPEFKNTRLNSYHIKLVPSPKDVSVKETEKRNQYLISTIQTEERQVSFNLWFELKKTTILIEENNKWINIKNSIHSMKTES